MKKRFTLNVSKEVYLALAALRTEEIRKSGKVVTVDDVLRKQLHIGKDKPS